MQRCAFLTTDLPSFYVTDDELAFEPLRRHAVEVELVRWREPVDWGAYDLVVVRSTWDYQRDPDRFLRTLEAIDRATRLENPLQLMCWNLRKAYLRELAEAGVPVVPTVWREGLDPGGLGEVFRAANAEEIVLKPALGAGGEDTFRLGRDDAARREAELLSAFSDRPLMVQPFLPGVLELGEASVVWIDGVVSHVLRKVPQPGEFRSQEEHGGRIEAIRPDTELSEAAARVARVVTGHSERAPLYGRVDFLPGPAGEWLVGELELVEPSLYLRTDPGAPERLAAAIARRLGSG